MKNDDVAPSAKLLITDTLRNNFVFFSFYFHQHRQHDADSDGNNENDVDRTDISDIDAIPPAPPSPPKPKSVIERGLGLLDFLELRGRNKITVADEEDESLQLHPLRKVFLIPQVEDLFQLRYASKLNADKMEYTLLYVYGFKPLKIHFAVHHFHCVPHLVLG